MEIQFIPKDTTISPPRKKENLNHNPQLKYTKSDLDDLIESGNDASEDGIVIDDDFSNAWG